MKYSVDRIEEDIVILENIETGEILEKNITDFDFEVKEAMIIREENDTFVVDSSEEEKRRAELQAKFDRLRKNESN